MQQVILVVLIMLVQIGVFPKIGRAAEGLNTAAIDQALGTAGDRQNEVYKISLPRTDLHVTVKGVPIKPALALTSWMAFKAHKGRVLAHGDLVLRPGEVAGVLQQFEQGGIMITALHNHLLEDSPQIVYLHFWGEGEAETLARTL